MVVIAIILGRRVATLEYLMGMIQLAYVMQLDFEKTLVIGLYPFIIKDIISVSLGVSIALQVKKIIYKYIL